MSDQGSGIREWCRSATDDGYGSLFEGARAVKKLHISSMMEERGSSRGQGPPRIRLMAVEKMLAIQAFFRYGILTASKCPAPDCQKSTPPACFFDSLRGCCRMQQPQ